MSRETKFRVWDIPNQCWSDLFHVITDDGALWHFPNSGLAERDDPEQYTVEQYTGLKDKNGKEIYEGDIVKTNSPDQPNFKAGVIEFVQQAFWISNVPSNRPDHTHSELLLQYWETEIEVIGNIHENPELLGGGNDNY